LGIEIRNSGFGIRNTSSSGFVEFSFDFTGTHNFGNTVQTRFGNWGLRFEIGDSRFGIRGQGLGIRE